MYRLLLILICCQTSGFVAGQVNNNIDSLEKDLERYTADDTVKLHKMHIYAFNLARTDAMKSIEVANQAIPLAQKLNWKHGLVNLYSDRSLAEALLEKYDASIASSLAALQIAEDNHLDDYLSYIHFDLSETYRLMKNYELAFYHAQRMYGIATARQNETELMRASALLAGKYIYREQQDSASLMLDKAWEIAVKTGNEYYQQQIIIQRADQLILMKDITGALALYRQALQFHLKKDNKNSIAWVYTVLSRLFTELNQKDSARYYANKALQLAQQYNLVKELKDAYEAQYMYHYRFGDYKKALEYRLIFDSLYYAANSLVIIQNAERARMELDQQRKEALAEAEKNKEKAEARRIQFLLYSAVAFITLVAGFLYWNNRQKQKAREKIERAFRELKAAQTQLVQAEKMASLGELTAGIAHEIQNPLNFVNNFSELNREMLEELKAERLKPNAERDEALQNELINDVIANEEKITHHGKRADAIVKGMLQHSRAGSGQKEPTDINALCDEYARLAYHGWRAKDKSFNTALETRFDPGTEPIQVIPQDTGRVILNLINNAFYAVNEKARQNMPGYAPAVIVSTRKANDKIEITVQDNGNGIPAAIKEKIFQPFFTTKPTGQGTGLGLSLSYDIVKAQGGELKVETTEGEGTRFIITLPVNIAK